jgi:hypothetical protein
VKIAGRKFRLPVLMPTEIAAGSQAPIRGVLPRTVLRHLARDRQAKVAVVIKVTDAVGHRVIQTIRVALD